MIGPDGTKLIVLGDLKQILYDQYSVLQERDIIKGFKIHHKIEGTVDYVDIIIKVIATPSNPKALDIKLSTEIK